MADAASGATEPIAFGIPTFKLNNMADVNFAAFKNRNKLFNLLIAAVWIANGLFCKVLNLVPRHEQIVARILGAEYAGVLTRLIGVAEVFMAIWVLSRVFSRLNAWTQIIIVAAMNILEFILAPDLLLWGRFNAVFAFSFVAAVYYNEFVFGQTNLKCFHF